MVEVKIIGFRSKINLRPGAAQNQILLIKAVCLARLQAREFGVATCVLKIFSKIFFLDFYN
jgi:hypothetical protein